MLVLSRQDGEQVVIGGGIVVTVAEPSGGSVKLGIEAPTNVSIRRNERAADHDVAAFRSQWREANPAKPSESPGPLPAGSAREASTSSNIRGKLLRRLSMVPR
jgi:carbon storage regulator